MREVKTSKTSSIYYRFLKLIVMAFLIAILFFVLLNRGGNLLLNSYFTKTNYMEQENRRRVEDLKGYVKKNRLTSEDTEKLTEWVRHQSVVWMQIYRDHILLYDSQFPYMEANPEYHVKGQFYEWESYQTIDFQDGPALVFLTGMYTYQFFNYALLLEFLLSFLLFTGITMAGIRSSMNYIRTLSAEIGILEGGDLDYRITVTGNDEMTVLAKGLDNMRKSIREQIGQEAELIRLNQSMITSLSHDLRTPLTALLIYTEILKNEIDADQKQRQKWVHKIDEKACQIKDMSDRILQYSLKKETADPVAAEPESFRLAFHDAVADICTCLEQKGFCVRTSMQWEEKKVRVEPEYVTRIFDNISSNIIKYASKKLPVQIKTFTARNCIGLLFENARMSEPSEAESNGIGLRNICEMMEAMGGSCQVDESEEEYRIRLTFFQAEQATGCFCRKNSL